MIPNPGARNVILVTLLRSGDTPDARKVTKVTRWRYTEQFSRLVSAERTPFRPLRAQRAADFTPRTANPNIPADAIETHLDNPNSIHHKPIQSKEK